MGGHNRSRLYISNKKRCSYKVISSWWDIAVSNAVKVHHKNRGAVSNSAKTNATIVSSIITS